MNGNGSSSRSTLAAGKLGGLPSGGAGGGEKPPRHPGRLKSTHDLDGATRGKRPVVPTVAGGGEKPPRHPGRLKSTHALDGGDTRGKRPAVPTVAGGEGEEGERFKCKTCKRFFIADEDLQCHIRRCHVHRNWRCRKEGAPPPPRKPLSSSSRTSKKGCPVVSKQHEQEQQTGEPSAAETPARTVVDAAFDLNVPAPEVEEEKTSSG